MRTGSDIMQKSYVLDLAAYMTVFVQAAMMPHREVLYEHTSDQGWPVEHVHLIARAHHCCENQLRRTARQTQPQCQTGAQENLGCPRRGCQQGLLWVGHEVLPHAH